MRPTRSPLHLWALVTAVLVAGGCSGSREAQPGVIEPPPYGRATAAVDSKGTERPAATEPPAPALRPPGPAAAVLATLPTVAVEPWSWDGPDGPIEGERLATRSFRISTTTQEGSSLRRLLPVFYETALAHYTSALTPLPEPPQPLETFLFATRAQWVAFTRRLLGRDAGTYLAIERGGYTVDARAVLFDLGRFDTLTLAAHEGWHQYTQATFRSQLPVWLEEGLATYMEGHRWNRGADRPEFNAWRNFERFGALREAVRREELIDLGALLEGMPQTFLRKDGQSALLTYYAQVWALTHFLAEGENGRYRAALDELLRDAVAGRIMQKVAQSPHLPPGRPRSMAARQGKTLVLVYFNPDFAAFKAEYDRFVAEITRRGAGDMIWRGRSPLAQPTGE